MDTPIIPPMKRCTKCGEEYPATSEYFNKNCKARDGLHPNCKTCRTSHREQNAQHIYEQKKRWRDNNPEKEKTRVDRWIRENDKRYRAKKHEYYLDHREIQLSGQREKYYHDHELTKSKRREHYQLNREKIREQSRKRYASNPEERRKAIEASRIWAQLNPMRCRASRKMHKALRRARELEAEGFFTAEDIRIAYRSQKGKCWHCFKPVGRDFHADHLISLKRGGTNWPNNIVISCPFCNLSKGAKSTQEWNGRLF